MLGERAMQISRPRDIGPLVLVVGLFLILFAVSVDGRVAALAPDQSYSRSRCHVPSTMSR